MTPSKMSTEDKAEEMALELFIQHQRLAENEWRERLAFELCKAYQEGFAEARERAENISLKGPPPGSVIQVDGDVRDPGVVVTGFQRWIADKISQMQPSNASPTSLKPLMNRSRRGDGYEITEDRSL